MSFADHYTKRYPYIFLHIHLSLYIYHHFYIIPTLFDYLLACHPYTFLQFSFLVKILVIGEK